MSSGVIYHDGQFDDSRLAINLAQTAIEQGATVLNYFKVKSILKDKQGKNEGVSVVDVETDNIYHIKSTCIINAAGIFTDKILKKNDPALSLPYYADVIQKIGIASVVIGVLLIFTVPFLKRWMGNVK